MKIHVLTEKENPYMKRKEFVLSVDHSSAPTPANAGLQQHLAKEWKAEAEQVEIRHIYSQVGRQASKVHAFLWNEKKVADLSKAAVAKPAEGATAPAAVAPAPAEAKK